MLSSPLVAIAERSLRVAIRLAIPFFYAAASLFAQSPTLTKIDPPVRTDLSKNTVSVHLTGTNFTNDMTLGFDPPGAITSSPIALTDSTTATVTFRVNAAAAPDTVNVWVQTSNGRSPALSFGTGVATSICLEAARTGVCELRWEVDATSATGSSNQTSNNTTPNIMVKLDYQLRAPLQPSGSRARSDHIAVHADFKTGYTQVVASTKVQQTSTSATSGTSTTCPGGSSSPTNNCTAAVPQQAYVAEVAAKVGWSTAVNGQGTFAEMGIGGRGSFEYLIPSDKIVQSGGLTYIDLSSGNPHNTVGFYEATGHFKLSQIGHNTTAPSSKGADKPKTQNVSNLLVFEAGYQNDRALQGLSTNSTTNTRNRYVARFYITPELPSTKHTQLTVGMEYSGGIDGGPHVVQLFFGTNVNPAKLFSKANN